MAGEGSTGCSSCPCASRQLGKAARKLPQPGPAASHPKIPAQGNATRHRLTQGRAGRRFPNEKL